MLWRPRLTSSTAIVLRTRYFPKSRIGQGLIGVAPWLSVTLLFMTFLIVGSQVLVQPGIVMELPSAPFTDGFQSRWLVVVMSVPSSGGSRNEVVFFDDRRFVVSRPGDMGLLRAAFDEKRRKQADPSMVIQADQSVDFGTVMKIVDIAREAGVKRVNQAVRAM
jgi:biopolymer transport protein ExbD